MNAGRPAFILADGQTIETTCLVEIEQTAESLHAHAIPEGVEIRAGDTVLVHDAPDGVAFGERLTRECRVTVTRAGRLTRLWTEFFGVLGFAELYDVGFEPKQPQAGLQPRRAPAGLAERAAPPKLQKTGFLPVGSS